MIYKIAIKTGTDIRKFAYLTLRTACLLGIFVMGDTWVMAISNLPEAGYYQPFLFLEVLKQSFSSIYNTAITTALVLVLLIRWRFFFNPWKYLEYGQTVRYFVTLQAFLLAWWFGTYDYNLYFDQAHYYDRFMLISLVALIYWRPIFILPFILVLSTLVWQSFYPIGGYSWAHQSMPLRLMMMFFAALILQSLTDSPWTKDFLFLSVCVIAAHYWLPGLYKMNLDWISYGHVYNFLPSTYANGWLGFLSTEQVSALTRNIMFLDKPIQIATLLLQLGSIVILWRRFTLVGLLFCWAVFHIGVFFVSGILFWQWMLLESGFLVLIRTLWYQQPVPFISTGHFILSALIIAGTKYWITPVGLAWYDVPISYTVRLEGVTSDNQRYSLSPRFFEPYEFQFSLGSFRYLSTKPQLSVTWGASTEREAADLLLLAKTPEQVHEVERSHGENRFNAIKTAAFEEFIQTFVSNLNKRGSKSTVLSMFHSPRQIWTFARDNDYAIQAPLETVNVYQVTSFFDGNRYQEIDRHQILSIDIPSPR